MSFAYTGWAIPEGNVVEVADASGRVIWSAGPSEVTVILRPIADGVASTGSNFHTAYPSGVPLYSCIDEEAADGDSTYIYNFGTSVIILSGTIPRGMKVTAAKVVYVAKYSDSSGPYSVINPQITFNGVWYNASGKVLSGSYERYEREYEPDNNGKTFLEFLNELGTGDISLDMQLQTAGDSENKTTEMRITQIYLELTCEK